MSPNLQYIPGKGQNKFLIYFILEHTQLFLGWWSWILTQTTLLMMFGEPFGMPEIKPCSAACNANPTLSIRTPEPSLRNFCWSPPSYLFSPEFKDEQIFSINDFNFSIFFWFFFKKKATSFTLLCICLLLMYSYKHINYNSFKFPM